MKPAPAVPNRRHFLRETAALAMTPALAPAVEPPDHRALVAITLDLEMSRNFPTRDQTHWDYEKGNLDAATKRYAVEAARRVKARGGVIHFFAVGRVLEQEDVSWLEEIRDAGHPVGNHTYDHVNVRAEKVDQLQFRFQRAPWLIEGRTTAQVIAENIRLTTRALQQRVGIDPVGFRTPGGFHDGLRNQPGVRKLIREQGFRWVSSLYPPHPNSAPGEPPTEAILDGIVAAQAQGQPFVYRDGLVEIPMSPISDVGAFRNGRWPLTAFLEAIRRGLAWAIDRRAVFDFLGHPSCLVAADPEFHAIDLICRMVQEAGNNAVLTGLEAFAARARNPGGE